MWGDRELCFLHDAAMQNVTSGVIGDPIDFGAGGQLNGDQAFLFIACNGDTTATGDPEISFSLEYADNPDFTDAKEIPVGGIFTKEQLSATDGALAPVIRLPLSPPVNEMQDRYYRLKLETSAALACTNMAVGIVLDPQTNW